MSATMAKRVGKLEEATRFTITTPGDLLNHPARLAMVRADAKRLSRAVRGDYRWFVEAVLAFSDALFVDFLFYDNENTVGRAAGKSEDELWEAAKPWWRAAYAREPEAVGPIIRAWERGGMPIEVAGGAE